MSTVEIPKGWRKLRKGEIVRDGDKYNHSLAGWYNTQKPGLKIGDPDLALSTYIRKLRKAASKGKAKRKGGKK